jgi:hypothetical protein
MQASNIHNPMLNPLLCSNIMSGCPLFGPQPEDGDTINLLTLATQPKANQKLLSVHFMF